MATQPLRQELKEEMSGNTLEASSSLLCDSFQTILVDFFSTQVDTENRGNLRKHMCVHQSYFLIPRLSSNMVALESKVQDCFSDSVLGK